ncbi:hypothetical protein FA13DRAFT_1747275, partial [Coprinellus micaceus]
RVSQARLNRTYSCPGTSCLLDSEPHDPSPRPNLGRPHLPTAHYCPTAGRPTMGPPDPTRHRPILP